MEFSLESALNSCKNIKKDLEEFPKHKRYPITTLWHLTKELEEVHGEILRRCIPFINKIVKEIKASIKDVNFNKILTRKAYIQKKLEEAKSLKNENKDDLIKEIERIKENNCSKTEKVLFNEEQSRKIIEKMFDEPLGNEGSYDVLNHFIELTYDKESNKKTEAYEKILQFSDFN